MQGTAEGSLPVALLATVASPTIALSDSPPVMLTHTLKKRSDSATVNSVSKNMTLATEWEGMKSFWYISTVDGPGAKATNHRTFWGWDLIHNNTI